MEFHITRVDDWAESQIDPILAESWVRVVTTDPELTVGGRMTVSVHGRLLREIEFVRWTSPTDGSITALHYDRGRISVTDPSIEALEKLKSVAQRLGAFVVDGNGAPIPVAPSTVPRS